MEHKMIYMNTPNEDYEKREKEFKALRLYNKHIFMMDKDLLRSNILNTINNVEAEKLIRKLRLENGR